eukprot:2573185-Pyramimonas_sp.AAC.1
MALPQGVIYCLPQGVLPPTRRTVLLVSGKGHPLNSDARRIGVGLPGLRWARIIFNPRWTPLASGCDKQSFPFRAATTDSRSDVARLEPGEAIRAWRSLLRSLPIALSPAGSIALYCLPQGVLYCPPAGSIALSPAGSIVMTPAGSIALSSAGSIVLPPRRSIVMPPAGSIASRREYGLVLPPTGSIGLYCLPQGV